MEVHSKGRSQNHVDACDIRRDLYRKRGFRIASISQLVSGIVTMLLALTAIGCAGALQTVGLVSGGSLKDAEYDGLEGQRVAIVCVSDSSSYGAGTEADLLAHEVATLLSAEVKDIKLVRASEVADWVDRNGWDQIDYREVGQGVKADRVVAIDLEGFRLHQDQTLYKGRVNITISVLDMQKQGAQVFRRSLLEFSFPRTGFVHSTDVSETRFRRTFISVVAEQLARHFYKYDVFDKSVHDGAFVLQ